MLVCFANHSTAPVSLGGAERSLLKLVEDWRETEPRLEPFFLTKAPVGRFVAALEERGWPYEAIRFRGWAGPSLADLRSADLARDDYAAVLRMIELMEQRRPDLVVTNTLVAPWAAFAAAALGIPHVWMVREFGDLDHGLEFATSRDATLSDIGLLSTRVIANSIAIRDRLAPHIPSEKITVAYPQLDAESIRAQASSAAAVDPFPAAEPGLRITTIGRVMTGKGQSRLIDALARLTRRGIAASVCFVGAAVPETYASVVREQARRSGVLDRITFAGEQSNPFPFVAAADVCVTASDAEAFGRTTLEYMILGKPVVATRAGGSPELVADGETGWLVAGEDDDALAEALLRYSSDPAARAAHGAAGAARAGELMTRYDNRGAITTLTEAAQAPAYRLPSIARYWFQFPLLADRAVKERRRRSIRSLPARVIAGVRRRLGGVLRAAGRR